MRTNPVNMTVKLQGGAPVKKTVLKKEAANIINQRLDKKQKVALLREKAEELIYKRDPDTNEEMDNPGDVELMQIAESLLKESPLYILNEISKLSEKDAYDIKWEIDNNSGAGITGIDFSMNIIGYFIPEYSAKKTEAQKLEEGLQAVEAAWKLRFSSAFMKDTGKLVLDDLKKGVIARISVFTAAAAKKKFTPERMAEIRAVKQMQGVLPENQIAVMMAKLNITPADFGEFDDTDE